MQPEQPHFQDIDEQQFLRDKHLKELHVKFAKIREEIERQPNELNAFK